MTASYPIRLCAGLLGLVALASAQPSAENSASVDDQGLTHVTRVVPVPKTISPQGQEKLIHPPPSILSSKATAEEMRAKMDARQKKDAEGWLKVYPAVVTESSVAGVPVHLVDPVAPDPRKADRVLINLHGGGFRTDSGSLLESIPIANLTGIKVVSVLYRMAPEHPFPAGVDDAIAVYRELLKTHKPEHIAVFGTSAGAILTVEMTSRIQQLGLPMPAALGVFSAIGDFTKAGDSAAIFSIQGLVGFVPKPSSGPMLNDYTGKADLNDPVLSPLFGHLSSFPPTLFMTSTRDMLLSGTVILYQAFLKAGVDSRLSVFEALPHAFWLDVNLPESRTACSQMASFLSDHLSR